jgi:acyl carrier protein
MSEAEKLSKVQRIIVEILGVKENEVQLQTNLINDLGADSLDHVELIMALEEEFDIEITDEAAEAATTVSDLLKLLEGRAAA